MNIFYLQYILQKFNLNFSLKMDKLKVEKHERTEGVLICYMIN